MNVEDCNATTYANVNHALDGEGHEAEESHFGPGDMDDMPPMTENITVLNCNNSSNISMQVGQLLVLKVAPSRRGDELLFRHNLLKIK